MNRYLVDVSNRSFTVDASNPRVAINRALRGFEQRQSLTITCRLLQQNIVRMRHEKWQRGGLQA